MPGDADHHQPSTVAATAAVTLPSGFLEMVSLEHSDGPRGFELMPYGDYLQRYISTQSGRPQVYAYQTSSTLVLGPVPDSVYTLTLTYAQKIPALSSSNTSNWLLALDPDAYLIGCLAKAAVKYQDDAMLATRLQQWQQISAGWKIKDTRRRMAIGGAKVRGNARMTP